MYKISGKSLGTAMLAANVGSFKELAALSGISINTLSRLNNGGSVKLNTIKALAGALNIDPERIMAES